MPEMWFFNRRDGHGVQGPVDLDHLAQLLHNGELAPNHEVRCGAIGEWASAADLKWYYNCKDGSGVHGPVTRVHLREALENEEISEGTEVREGGLGEWQELPVVLGMVAAPATETSATSTAAAESETDAADEDDFELNVQSSSPSAARTVAEEEVVPDTDVTPDADAWYCDLSGQIQGPLPWSRIHSLASMGRMKRSDRVRHATERGWNVAGEVAGLFPKSSPVVEQVPPPAPAAESVQWYCQLGGVPMGPMAFEQLKKLADDDRVKPDDQVRPENDAAWVTASSVPGLFGPPPAAASATPPDSKSAVAAPTDETAGADAQADAPPAPAAKTPPAPAIAPEANDKLAAWLDEEVQDTKSSAPEEDSDKPKVAKGFNLGFGKSDKAAKPAKPEKTRTKKAAKPIPRPKAPKPKSSSPSIDFGAILSSPATKGVAGAVVIALVAYGLYAVLMGEVGGGSQNIEAYAVYKEFWDEYTKLRKEKADAAAWSEFTSRTNQKIEPLVAELLETASSKRRAEQALLYVGRDCIPKMLTDGRQRPCKEEEYFIDHLATVRKVAPDAGLPFVSADASFK